VHAFLIAAQKEARVARAEANMYFVPSIPASHTAFAVIVVISETALFGKSAGKLAELYLRNQRSLVAMHRAVGTAVQ
jgi:hypothetical protein